MTPETFAKSEHDLLLQVETYARLVQSRNTVTHHEAAARQLKLGDALEKLEELREQYRAKQGKEAANG